MEGLNNKAAEAILYASYGLVLARCLIHHGPSNTQRDSLAPLLQQVAPPPHNSLSRNPALTDWLMTPQMYILFKHQTSCGNWLQCRPALIGVCLLSRA